MAVKNYIRKNTYITQEQEELINSLAKKHGKSFAYILRQIIDVGVKCYYTPGNIKKKTG